MIDPMNPMIDPMDPKPEDFNANLVPTPEDESPKPSGKKIAKKSLDPKSFEMVEVEPVLVADEDTEAIALAEAGAVRIYVPNPEQKLTPEDVENRRIAAEQAAAEKTALEAALKAVAEMNKQPK